MITSRALKKKLFGVTIHLMFDVPDVELLQGSSHLLRVPVVKILLKDGFSSLLKLIQIHVGRGGGHQVGFLGDKITR